MASKDRERGKRERKERNAREPVGRKESFSFVHNHHFYACQGEPLWHITDRSGEIEYVQDHLLPLQRFDFSSAQWSSGSPECVVNEQDDVQERWYWSALRGDFGVCCAVLGNCVYTYGGFSVGVHELNLETMIWRKLKSQNQKDGSIFPQRAGMVACGDEALCIFGGYGGAKRPQPGATYHKDSAYPHADNCWCNDLHYFHVKTCKLVQMKLEVVSSVCFRDVVDREKGGGGGGVKQKL